MLPAFLGRAVFLGGGLFGNALGGAVKGIGSAVGGIAQGAGSAVGGIAQGIGSAVGGAVTPAPKVVVNNVGIAGEAAKKKVTGSGTLPTPKKSAKPAVNANMPTEKLLVVAVNYLSSIDKTLQDQIKFESQAFNQQVQAERETSIEDKKTGVFTKLSDKFGGLLKTGEDSTMKSRAGDITKVILGATGLAALGALGLAGMDDTELARLKTSWSAFTEKYAWLSDLASAVTGAGSFIGYLVGGMRGAVFGMIADWMSQRLTGSSIGDTLLSALGLGGTPTDATAAREPNTGFDYAMGGVVAGYGAYRGVKTYKDVRGRMTKAAAQRAAPRADPTLKGSGFRDPKTGRVVSREAAKAGGGWLSGPKGQRFVSYLSKRFGKTWLAKVIKLLARVFAGVAATATVVGAIPGILWTLVNVGLAIWTVYDLLDAWWDFQDEEEARGDAEAANAAKPSSSTTPSSLSPSSGDASPASSKPASDATALPPAAKGSIDSILDKNPEQLTDAELRQLVEAQGRIEDPRGVTNNPGGILYGTGPLKDHQIGFKRANGDSSVKIAVYDTPENGIRAAMENWRNSRYYRGKSVREGLGTWSGGNGAHYAKMLGSARPGYDGTNNPQGETGLAGDLAQGAWDLGKGLIESIGGIISAGLGPMTVRSTTESLSGASPFQNLSASTPGSTPGGDNAAPVVSESKKAAEISQASSKIQSAIDMGNPKSDSSTKMPSSPAQASLRSASSDSKLECIDPNYPGTGGVDRYLQYYRLAA
jgi:hypothetical protein